MKKGEYFHRKNCRLCLSTDLSLILDLGYMPLAGNYLKKDALGTESYFPLRVYFCGNCTTVQLLDIISSDEIFKDYRYLSSVGLTKHFESYAKEVRKLILKKDAFVLEIGSNDGVLLAPLKDFGFRVLGVDPAANVAKIARGLGLETIVDFFTEKKAKEIVKIYGKADVIVANNVLAHIDDMHDVSRGITALLDKDGVLIFEVHYLINLLNDLQYDFFYPGEHITYYSLIAICKFYKQFGMEVFDVEQIATHGGSIRVFVRKEAGKKRQKTKRFLELLEREKKINLTDRTFFTAFAKRAIAHKKELKKLLLSLKKKHKKIVGYGAAGRGNTLLNYCGIDSKLLDYIVDASPERFNRYTPGTHIPIISPKDFHADKQTPDYLLILAWSYKEMIIQEEKDILQKGAKIIIPLPKITIE